MVRAFSMSGLTSMTKYGYIDDRTLRKSASRWMLAPGAMPIEPTTARTRSDRKSPMQFDATTTLSQSRWLSKWTVISRIRVF